MLVAQEYKLFLKKFFDKYRMLTMFLNFHMAAKAEEPL